MSELKKLIAVVEQHIDKELITGKPEQLYDPIAYLLRLGGKRIRPCLVLASYNLYHSEFNKEVYRLSSAVELFHNFTLMHDDIMDNASMRRSKPTVHTKWDSPTAILSGDLLLIQVYNILTEIGNTKIISKFNKMATELCEGQMEDMMFIEQAFVTNEDYLTMIRKKTAVLLGFCLESGAILAGASDQECEHLYNLGISLGLSFQLTDDYLDSFGTAENFGKKIGGDILEKKKTFLWNAMLPELNFEQNEELESLYHNNSDIIITTIKNWMVECGADLKTLDKAKQYHQIAETELNQINATNTTSILLEIVTLLSNRQL